MCHEFTTQTTKKHQHSTIYDKLLLLLLLLLLILLLLILLANCLMTSSLQCSLNSSPACKPVTRTSCMAYSTTLSSLLAVSTVNVAYYPFLINVDIHAGVKHPSILCDACRENGITGIRWKCVRCYNFDLCNICYSDGKHSLEHEFSRIDVLEGPRYMMHSSCLYACFVLQVPGNLVVHKLLKYMYMWNPVANKQTNKQTNKQKSMAHFNIEVGLALAHLNKY